MHEIKVSEMIRKFRTDKGVSQETLAGVCDVSMQAVSKWENEQSYPDISLLPLLAEYFGVSIDYLLTGWDSAVRNTADNLVTNLAEQDFKDDVLYIVQYRNGKIVDKKQWNKERAENATDAIRIQFDDEFAQLSSTLSIEVWGDANMEAFDGTINLSAGANVNCGTVEGNIRAGASVNCSSVEGNVSAGNSVNCDTIEGNVSAGASVSCDTIEGDASAGTFISCDTIEGSAKAGTHIEYKQN